MSFTRLHLRESGSEAAHPARAALGELAVAALVLVVGLAFGVRWVWVLAVACSLLAVGAFRAARAAVEVARLRRTADEWLLWGATARPSSALLTWRAEELTSPRLRSTLAHSLRRIEREGRGVTRPGPVPLNKRAIRLHLHLVRALHERLDDRSRPATVRGILLVDRLLTEPGSPFYSTLPDDVLAQALSEALTELDAVPPALAA
jgi:hypothetical protein